MSRESGQYTIANFAAGSLEAMRSRNTLYQTILAQRSVCHQDSRNHVA
jgi:hypothetical protein